MLKLCHQNYYTIISYVQIGSCLILAQSKSLVLLAFVVLIREHVIYVNLKEKGCNYHLLLLMSDSLMLLWSCIEIAFLRQYPLLAHR